MEKFDAGEAEKSLLQKVDSADDHMVAKREFTAKNMIDEVHAELCSMPKVNRDAVVNLMKDHWRIGEMKNGDGETTGLSRLQFPYFVGNPRVYLSLDCK